MQTFLKFLLTLIGVFVVFGLFLDNEFEVSREVTIDAPAEAIHSYVNDLNQWPQWSPWQQLDPSVKVSIGEVSSGVGASQSWTDSGGGGELTFTESSAKTGIQYDLTFSGDPSVFKAAMQYQPKGNQTLVRWVMKGQMEPIIIGNYFAQLMDALVGDSFTLGLENLKKQVENTSAEIPQTDS